MRPALTMTFLVVALMAFLPAHSSAQTGDRNASSDGASADTAPVEQTRNTEPPSEAEKAEAKRLARLERLKEEEQLRQERARLCVIKPVMTDAEIARCKEAWR
ncbi:MAG: hypothetical protein IPG33_06695 [Betaproteobacteria bacterium]|nr:hypothetical protein [Betaproteobacteria bacterium]